MSRVLGGVLWAALLRLLGVTWMLALRCWFNVAVMARDGIGLYVMLLLL